MRSKPASAAGNHKENARREYRSGDLRDDIGQQLGNGKSLGERQADRHGGIQVTSRNVPYRIGHGQKRQPKRQRNAHETDTQTRESRRNHSASATAENEPKSAEKSAATFFLKACDLILSAFARSDVII